MVIIYPTELHQVYLHIDRQITLKIVIRLIEAKLYKLTVVILINDKHSMIKALHYNEQHCLVNTSTTCNLQSHYKIIKTTVINKLKIKSKKIPAIQFCHSVYYQPRKFLRNGKSSVQYLIGFLRYNSKILNDQASPSSNILLLPPLPLQKNNANH